MHEKIIIENKTILINTPDDKYFLFFKITLDSMNFKTKYNTTIKY